MTKQNHPENPEIKIAQINSRQAIYVAIIGAFVSIVTTLSTNFFSRQSIPTQTEIDSKIDDKLTNRISAAENGIVYENVPVGTIIPSVLSFKTFLEANQLNETQNMETAIWVPSDGRSVSGSKYAKFNSSGENVPDLRGVFIRGVNDMGVNGAPQSNRERLNPESKSAGQYQLHSFQNHRHLAFINENTRDKNSGVTTKNRSAFRSSNDSDARYVLQGNSNEPSVGRTSAEGNSTETRPTNISLYYYIKIN